MSDDRRNLHFSSRLLLFLVYQTIEQSLWIRFFERYTEKRICWISKIGRQGWPQLRYFTAWEWDISQLENKDIVFIQSNIMFNWQRMRLATRDHLFVWLNKLFFQCTRFFNYLWICNETKFRPLIPSLITLK